MKSIKAYLFDKAAVERYFPFNKKALFFMVLAYVIYSIHILRLTQDFAVFHLAGLRFSELGHLYQSVDGYQTFKYSPLFAMLMAPIGVLPFGLAKQVWMTLNFVAFILVIYFLINALKNYIQAGKLGSIVTWTILFVWITIDDHFLAGQVNVIIMYLELLALAFLLDKKNMWSGLCLALAILFKLTPLIIIPYFIIKRGFRAIAWTGVFILIGLIAPSLFYGWQGNTELLQAWLNLMQEKHDIWDPNSFPFVDSVNNVIFSLFGPYEISYQGFPRNIVHLSLATTKMIYFAFVFALGLWFLYFIWQNWKKGVDYKLRSLVEFSFLLMMQTVLSPLAWRHTFVTLIPVVFLFHIFYRPQYKKWYIFLFCFSIIFALPSNFSPYTNKLLEFYWINLQYALACMICLYMTYKRWVINKAC